MGDKKKKDEKKDQTSPSQSPIPPTGSPQQLPIEQCLPGSYPVGSFSPTQYPPGSYPLPNQYSPGSYPPTQYPPGSYTPTQYPVGSYIATQYPPGSCSPTQYPPGVIPPQGLPYNQPYGQPQQPYVQGQPVQSDPCMQGYCRPGYPCGQYPPQQYPQQQCQNASQQTNTNSSATIPGVKVPKQKYILMGPYVPSLKVAKDFNPETDAKALEKAYKGFGCDSKTVMKILTHRSYAQRDQIKNEYKKIFKKDLIDVTKKELMDTMEYSMVSLFYSGAEQDAYFLKIATKAVGTFDDIITQILCTRSSAQLISIIQIYQKMNGKCLMESIKSVTSGSYRKLLIYLLENPRKEGIVDPKSASDIAISIYEKNILKTSAPESLIEKLCACGYEQMIQINQQFYAQYSKPLYKNIKSYTIGSYENALMTMYYYIHNPVNYFAKFLRKSIKKNFIFGVLLVICTRCDIDLETIALAYKTNYKTNLHDDIKQAFTQFHSLTVEAFEMLLGIK